MQNDEMMVRFERWVRAFQPVVYRAAYLILRDRAGAEDVAQETFIRAYRSMVRSDPGDSVRSWLYRIAVNTALNELRRRKRESAAISRVTTDNVPDHSSGVETSAIVADAVDRLPDHLRIPVICRYFLDLTEQEMAEVLHVRPGTVKSCLHLARKALESDERLAVNA